MEETKTEAKSTYAKAKIYKLYSPNDDKLIYIGSTCCMLERRKFAHKKGNAPVPRSTMAYFEKVGWDRVYIKLIENYPCTSRAEMQTREDYWVNELKPALNKEICFFEKLETKTEVSERKAVPLVFSDKGTTRECTTCKQVKELGCFRHQDRPNRAVTQYTRFHSWECRQCQK